jgi:hypothetical protein
MEDGTVEQKECECCHERPGETNSEFLFNSPQSTPECGDWVCRECEEEACHETHDERGNRIDWPACLWNDPKEE